MPVEFCDQPDSFRVMSVLADVASLGNMDISDCIVPARAARHIGMKFRLKLILNWHSPKRQLAALLLLGAGIAGGRGGLICAGRWAE